MVTMSQLQTLRKNMESEGGLRGIWRTLTGEQSRAVAPQGALDAPLVRLNRQDSLTGRHLMENWHVWGGIGSAKTTATGSKLALSMLRAGWGGLVMCYRASERSRWEMLMRRAGRRDRPIIVTPGGEHQFNVSDYLAYTNREGTAENLATVVLTIGEVAERNAGRFSGGDRFWHDTSSELITNTFAVLLAAGIQPTHDNLLAFIHSAPKSVDEIAAPEWQGKSFCFNAIAEALLRTQHAPAEKRRAVAKARDYFLGQFPRNADNTRAGIVATVASMVHAINGEITHALCSADRSTFCPELAQEGAVIILDIPVERYREAGQFAQILFKYVFQQSVMVRNSEEELRPVFLFADEHHYFLTSLDWAFISVAREKRCANIAISQNLSNYLAALGGTSAAQSQVESLLGNFNHIFHSNAHAQTNQWAAELIGKEYVYHPVPSWNESRERDPLDSLMSGSPSSETQGVNFQPMLDYIVPPYVFARELRRGGPEHGMVTDAIVFQGGRTFSNGRNTIWVEVEQHV